MGEIDVRPVHRADVRVSSRVLGRAFYDDPVMTWMMPDSAARAKGLPRGFATMTRHHFLARGGSEVATRDGAIGGAALWDPPGKRKSSRLEELVMMPGLLWAFRWRVSVMEPVLELMEANHPEEPHWYLMIIGSDPTVRGAGLGQALMRSRLDRCDQEHAPSYLEATKPELVPYYQRFGFEVTGEIKLPDGGPSMWPMWRTPR
ncbi:GNAT family N-acetyltransferase [Mycobacterium sp.]|jgi:GNAT superfamily N-acetyltransferase|uniref:GNAT family N-acetyltransferase n=1 Tax=Mycobacterium sp. TaxID=1785 RepID=UPI002D4486AD|nr:GNAT family N-acetyltransferase [Mycobacterium sp.]HZA10892.1 GNAT family N-acetyltransferase [Mycobacterium sp.]